MAPLGTQEVLVLGRQVVGGRLGHSRSARVLQRKWEIDMIHISLVSGRRVRESGVAGMH